MSNDSLSDKNKIVFNGKEMELKTLSGTVGPSVVCLLYTSDAADD